MRLGRLTQTAWNRSVRKQLHIEKHTGNAKREVHIPSPWQECAALDLDLGEAGAETLWAEASVQGSGEETGYFAVLQAAGRLAAAGGKPSGLSAHCYLPEEATEELCGRIAAQVRLAGEEMGLTVRAFCGETLPFLGQPVLHVTAVGLGRRLEGCEPGQEILFCGYAGLEGMLCILKEAEGELRERFTPSFLAQAEACRKDLVLPGQMAEIMEICTEDGLPCVTAARQVTEGGILAQLWNFAEEQGIGFDIRMKQIALRQETVELCECFGLNPYQMTSAGSYLLAVRDADTVIRALEKVGARAGRLGVVKAQKARTITSGEETRYLDRPAPDELTVWRAGRLKRGEAQAF